MSYFMVKVATIQSFKPMPFPLLRSSPGAAEFNR